MSDPEVLDRLATEANSERLVIYVSPSLRIKLESVAAKNHRSMSDWARLTLAEVLAGHLARVDLTGD